MISTSLLTMRRCRELVRNCYNVFHGPPAIVSKGNLSNLAIAPSLLTLFFFIFSICPQTSSAEDIQTTLFIPINKLSTEQAEILEFFTYDAPNERLVIKGTAERPLSDVFFQNINVRGASQVRQDIRANGPDIPDTFVLVEIEEEDITLGSAPNNNQAVVVHAYANIDSSGGVACPCEFRSFIVQDDGLPSEVMSPPNFLEVEGGDNDIDATISHTFAFIATAQTQNYSFQVQVFASQGAPGNGVYEVDEVGITIATYGLASTGVLRLPGNTPNNVDIRPEAAVQ